VILFRDIDRSLSNPVLRWINRTIGRSVIRAAATQNMASEHVVLINHIYFLACIELVRQVNASRNDTRKISLARGGVETSIKIAYTHRRRQMLFKSRNALTDR
jgi:hypothetical protein